MFLQRFQTMTHFSSDSFYWTADIWYSVYGAEIENQGSLVSENAKNSSWVDFGGWTGNYDLPWSLKLDDVSTWIIF